ncbi:hypothetical protein [Weissella confusa]|uniref:hypothetical protein n=1 Tax=Weissella confusa TaxID=1583 RepID=UPI0022E1B58A|nr:hypothetical protein [Weissella confusa]
MGWLIFIGIILALVFMPKNMLMGVLGIGLLVGIAIVAFVAFSPELFGLAAIALIIILVVIIGKLRKYVRK